MSLSSCKECGHQISSSAAACPQCGAKVRRTSTFTKIAAGFFALVFGVAVLSRCEQSKKHAEAAEAARVEAQRVAALTPEQRASEATKKAADLATAREAKAKEDGLRWSYSERQDAMGRGNVKFASVLSLNKFEFRFPYQGRQQATLTLRKSPKDGRSAILSVEKGQFLCSPSSGCAVVAKFGDGKMMTFSASEPDSGRSDVIFINNHDKFVEGLKKVKKLYIEAKFYQEPPQVIEFDVSNLEW